MTPAEQALIKYYEFFLTGEIVKDATGNPVKNADGTIQVKYTRDTVPDAALIAAGMTSNKFFNCEAVEVNVASDKLASTSGKSWDIGPVVNKGTQISIFYNTQKEVYKAIIERFLAGKFTIVQKAEDGDPIIHLSNWALPGRVVEYETGFPYFVMVRNKKTKVLENLVSHPRKPDGTLDNIKVVKTTGTLFLFANELPAMEAHIKNAIAALEPYKVPAVAGTERKEEVIAANAPAATAPVKEVTTI
jgi:hypothetical protein